MLRYPLSTTTCAHCKIRTAMHDDTLCGYCVEQLEGKPTKPDHCKSCGSPHGIWIQRSLANPSIWIRGIGGSEGEPGFGENRRNTVLANGYCRFCFEQQKKGRKG